MDLERLERLESVLGRLLGIGVTISTVLLLVGLGLSLAAGRAEAGSAFVNAGLIVLMATPIVRVIVSFVEYVREGDWFFAATTFAVLVVLTVTVTVAWRAS